MATVFDAYDVTNFQMKAAIYGTFTIETKDLCSNANVQKGPASTLLRFLHEYVEIVVYELNSRELHRHFTPH